MARHNGTRIIHWGRVVLVFTSIIFTGNLLAAHTLIVGNKAYTGSMQSNSGPIGDGYARAQFTANANQIVIPRATGLEPSNLKLQLGQTDTAANGNDGLIYCAEGTGTPISLESHLVAAPYTYGGHKLFRTNITGLYFTMRMYNLNSYQTDSGDDFYIGDAAKKDLTLRSQTCSGSTESYQAIGGLLANIEIEFYNDATFIPGTTGSIALLSDTTYQYSLTNNNPGNSLFSKSIYQTFNLDNITLTSPTCSTAVLSGNTVTQGDTVGLGDYSPKEVIDGANGVPFMIQLENCYRVTNIEVKMTTAVAALSPSLLGNALTSNHANGVGVEIKGLSNARYPEVVLIPNTASSVYKAYMEDTDTTNGIIGAGADGDDADTLPDGKPGSQALNFIATLKQDGNQQITGGDFKATAVFSITYP